MICIRKIENVTTSVSLVSGKCVCIYIEVCVARPSCVRVLSLQESTGGCENVCVCVCVCVCGIGVLVLFSKCLRIQAGMWGTTEAWLHRVSISFSIGSDLLL